MEIWCFSCLQCPKCLTLVVELSYHRYKESSNELPIKPCYKMILSMHPRSKKRLFLRLKNYADISKKQKKM